MKKIVLITTVLFMIAALTLSAGGKKEEKEGSKAERKEAAVEAVAGGIDRSDDLYVVVSMFTGIDYHIEYIRALEIIEKELGVKTEFVGPADYNINEMIASIEQAITKQAEGLIIMGWEETLEPVIGKAMDAGIPVITVTADLPASDRMCFIGIDNFDVGKKSAEFLAEQLNYKGKVAILRAVGLPNVQLRYEGFAEVIDSYPNMELVADLDHKNDSATAAQLVTGVLLKNPDMGGIYAADGLSGPGVVAGLKDAGMVGKVKVIASDREDPVLASIEDGFLDATIIAQTALEPYLAIKLIDSMRYSGLELSMDDEAVGLTLIPPRVHSGSYIVDKSNVKFFRRDYKGGKGKATQLNPDRSDDLYVVVSMFTGIDYHIEYIRALEIIEEELGVKTEFVGPADYNINEMIASIEQAITKQAEGLIIMGWEETLEPVIGKAMDAGIPVITVTADLPASDRMCFIGIDNFDVGKKSAEFLAEQLNYKGKVAILRAVGLPNVQLRYEGFAEVIDSYPNMELVADLDHKNDSATAAQLVTGVLLKNPDMGGIYAADGLSGPGVVAGLKDAGMVGKVKVIASDREDPVLASIEDGFLDATIIAQTALEPYLAIKLIDSMRYSGLELSMDDEAVGITLIPPRVHSGSFIVDKSNVKYYRRDYKK